MAVDTAKTEFDKLISAEKKEKIQKALEKGNVVEIKIDKSGDVRIFEKKLKRIE